MSRTTWAPAGGAGPGAATGTDETFGDRFPTQPIAIGRSQVRLVLDALREAAQDAADDGVTFFVNSGWRSRVYQDQLLREAIADHGSEKEAARRVATADTSLHVSGDAIDIEPTDATTWLSTHGAEYGPCQIYRNETRHYELRPDAVDRGCPRMYADPTPDPRMQQ